MRTNYVLIDFENVQPEELRVLDLEHVRIIVFVGANQTKVPVPMALELQKMGERAQYMQMSGNGKNALDFHIAYHMGRLAEQDLGGYFHIISKDTGFDPLIQHLKESKISARRSACVKDIPFLNPVQIPESVADRAREAAVRLGKLGASRPRLVKTLRSSLHALFQKALNDAEIDAIIQALKKEKKVTVTENKVTYNL